MKTLIWSLAAVVVAIWSGLCWIAHALVGVAGQIAGGNADILPGTPPELVEWMSWLAFLGAGIGEWIIVAIWAIVSLAIAAGAFVVTRFVPKLKSA